MKLHLKYVTIFFIFQQFIWQFSRQGLLWLKNVSCHLNTVCFASILALIYSLKKCFSFPTNFRTTIHPLKRKNNGKNSGFHSWRKGKSIDVTVETGKLFFVAVSQLGKGDWLRSVAVLIVYRKNAWMKPSEYPLFLMTLLRLVFVSRSLFLFGLIASSSMHMCFPATSNPAQTWSRL